MLAAVLLVILAPASRAEPSCLSRVAAQIAGLRASFPRLDGLNLALEPFESGTDFYRAQPRAPWRAPRERVYAVLVSRRACDDPPPPDAEKAILAHELAHLEAYSALGRGGLLRLGWAYAVRPEGKEVAAFEKAADDAAVERGFAEGLARYREWLYPRVPPRTAALKKKLYRTPAELRAKFPKMPE